MAKGIVLKYFDLENKSIFHRFLRFNNSFGSAFALTLVILISLWAPKAAYK